MGQDWWGHFPLIVQRTQDIRKKAAGRRALRPEAACLCDVPRGDPHAEGNLSPLWGFFLAPRMICESGSQDTVPGTGRARGLFFPPDSASGPTELHQQLRAPRTVTMRTCLCSLFAGDLLNASLFLARTAPASSSSAVLCLLHRGKKKGHNMFGKICRSVEHFLWAKRRGGQRGRERACSLGSGCALLAAAPSPRRGSFLLGPFSGPATFALEETVIVPPQQAPQSSALAGISLIPARSSRKRSGLRRCRGPLPRTMMLGATVARWPPRAGQPGGSAQGGDSPPPPLTT